MLKTTILAAALALCLAVPARASERTLRFLRLGVGLLF